MPRSSSDDDVCWRQQQNAAQSCRLCDSQLGPDMTKRIRPTRHSTRRRRRRLLTPTNLLKAPMLLAVFIAALLVASPVAAVKITFDNCLPETKRDSQDLQWLPLWAEASFKKDGKMRKLIYTVWGDVKGAQDQRNPPPINNPDDEYWRDNDQINGKIAERDHSNYGTTVFRRVNSLSYEPLNERTSFCRSALLGNFSCPLAPRFKTLDTSGSNRFDFPSINISHDFTSSYSFTSLATTLLMVYGDDAATNIGCISSVITPALDENARIVKFFPLAVLIFVGFAVVFAGIFSPWGSADIFSWSSNYGRDADLLRLVTPGFGDCLQYIQFIVLSGSLTLSYPGFFQPIVSQLSWSTLMFNESFVTDAKGYETIQDGMYVYKDAKYGLHRLAQLVGMENEQDVWAGLMVWLCVIILSTFVIAQLGFLAQWLYRKINNNPEEDLREKNVPFCIGNVIRIVFNFMLLPLISLSTFQLVIAKNSPRFVDALAVLTIVVLIGFAAYLLWFVVNTKPKAVLFDDLPTVLRVGPLYNTYSDEAAAFALIPFLLTFIRGIAVGAVQPSGVAQVVILAVCEVVQVFTLHAFKPFQSSTSMNAYHTVFSALRLIIILLLITFVPSLGLTEGPKGWIGNAILILHGCVLFFGFFLSALQTVVEVTARMLGAGGDDTTGFKRGGLVKIFGMRQLARRENPRSGPSRASQLSTSAMIDAADPSKAGYVMPSGRLRSGSGASLSGIVARNRRISSSVLDSADMYSSTARTLDSPTSYLPGTPGQASTFSFVPAPSASRGVPVSLAALEAADPYYRPPRRRREDGSDPNLPDPQRVSLIVDPRTNLQPPGPEMFPPQAADSSQDVSRGTTPVPGTATTPGTAAAGAPVQGPTQANLPANRPDYATREVDFYYGVRGPALNSEHIGRKLGTGPADPTGPIATATGWVRNMFGGKTKDKTKGFEVVRSSRMPQAVARNGGYGDETPPEGTPVALGVLRNGPIDSDDDDGPVTGKTAAHKEGDLLDDQGNPRGDEDEDEDDSDIESPISALSDDAPEIPRKSSKRDSATMGHAHTPSLSVIDSHTGSHGEGGSNDGGSARGHKYSRSASAAIPRLPNLPFERTKSQKRASAASSLEFGEGFTDIDLGAIYNERPASFGIVPQHGISRVDPQHPHLGSSAELVDEDGKIKQT